MQPYISSDIDVAPRDNIDKSSITRMVATRDNIDKSSITNMVVTRDSIDKTSVAIMVVIHDNIDKTSVVSMVVTRGNITKYFGYVAESETYTIVKSISQERYDSNEEILLTRDNSSASPGTELCNLDTGSDTLVISEHWRSPCYSYS